MSDSSDDSPSVDIPYSKRPEWADVTPIVQDEDTNDICRIAYTETFKEVFGYFRAMLRLNEKSERALELTRDAALQNPANYTVWYYRRLIIDELKSNLTDELEFISNVIRSHPKNYQVWQHRRYVVEKLNDASEELTFTQNIIKRDTKNYHAWQYRQWVIKHFSLWSRGEYEYVEHLLELDVRNNSAWNQRFFCLAHQIDEERSAAASARDSTSCNESIRAIVSREIDFTLAKIALCVDNESSWNYLRPLVARLIELDASEGIVAPTYPQNVLDFCMKQWESSRDEECSPFLVAFLVDYNYFLCQRGVKKNEISENDKNEIRKLVKSSLELLDSLATRFDTIRVNYWKYLASKWEKEFKNYL